MLQIVVFAGSPVTTTRLLSLCSGPPPPPCPGQAADTRVTRVMLLVSCYTCHVTIVMFTRVQEALLLRARGAEPAGGGQGEAGAEGHHREYHHSLLHCLFVCSKYTGFCLQRSHSF